MKYLMVYQKYSIQFYPQKELTPYEKYSVGRITADNHPYIGFDPSLNFIGRQHGAITSIHNRLYYSVGFNLAPTLFNNQKIRTGIFPLESGKNLTNVLTIKETKYPQAFIFTSDHADWDLCRLRKKDIKIGNLAGNNDIVLEDELEKIAVFQFVGNQYYLVISEPAKDSFFQINDDNFVENISENICVDKEKTYRFVYKKRYMFIVGGPVILYGKI